VQSMPNLEVRVPRKWDTNLEIGCKWGQSDPTTNLFLLFYVQADHMTCEWLTKHSLE
jgi:hypothetical protein